MDLSVDQARFFSALSMAASVADKRGSTPVLSNVLLDAQSDGTLYCSATDTKIYLRQRIPAAIERTGSLTVAVKHLLAVTKTLHAGSLQLEAMEDDRLALQSGRSKFQILGLPEREFPSAPFVDELKYCEIKTAPLLNLIQKTLFSVCTDEARLNLNGALLDLRGEQATMVSTDGHRLTRCVAKIENLESDEPKPIISRKGLIELKKVLERAEKSIQIGITNQYLFAKTSDLNFAIRLLDVTFPPYERVIPETHARKVELPRKELISALRSAEVIAPDKTPTVRLQFTETELIVTADNPELGVSTQSLEIEMHGDPLTTGFNARYLIEALEATPGDFVFLHFQGELDPCRIEPTSQDLDLEFTAVVMPIRIEQRANG